MNTRTDRIKTGNRTWNRLAGVTVGSLVLVVMLGCVLREEKIRIAKDGSVAIELGITGEATQINEGDAMPSAASGWKVERTTEIRDGKDAFLRVVRVVAKAAQRVSRRMDIGNFSKGAIDGEFGHICVCSFGDVIAAVLCEFGTPVDRILADLQELVAGSLYMSGRAQ